MVLVSLLLSVSVFAQTQIAPGVYTVRNQEELRSVLENEPPNAAGVKEIIFIDNVTVGVDPRTGSFMEFSIAPNEHVIIDLDAFNFQGNSPGIFGGGTGSRLTIHGGTTAFNGGFELHGDLTLEYRGIYSTSGVDRFGITSGDNVTVELTTPGTVWKGLINPGPYLSNLAVDGARPGTMIIGDAGVATMTVRTDELKRPANLPEGGVITVRNSETVLGAQRDAGVHGMGTLTLSGGTVDWYTSGSFYVGYEGTGRLNILDGIDLKTGSIVVGKRSTADGRLEIDGEETVVSLYGRLETGNGILRTEGTGVMRLTGGALVKFDDLAAPLPLPAPSGSTPKLGLGEGLSEVIGSRILGIRMTDALTKEKLIGPSGMIADQPLIGIFDQAGWIVGTTTGELDGNWNDNQQLIFRYDTRRMQDAWLEGSLNVAMRNVIFAPGSVLSPGEGQYGDALFGRINFISETFDHRAGARTFIDFSVHGDMNFDPADQRAQAESAYQAEGVYYEEGAYLGDRGRDVISVTRGDAILGGEIHFRPQSGYYTKKDADGIGNMEIVVHFLETDRVPLQQYDSMHLYPNRWFEWDGTSGGRASDPNDYLIRGADGMRLHLRHNETPFTDAAITKNTRSVGRVLEGIYNEQTNKEWLTVLDWMWLMDDRQFRRAMQELAGETRASSFFMPTRSPWRLVFDRMDTNDLARYREMQQRRLPRDCGVYLGHSMRTTSKKNGLWASSFYDFRRANDDGNVSAASNSRIGVITGYDRALSNRSSLGFVFLYSHPELTQRASRVTADEYLVGLHYNAFLQNRYELKLWGSYGIQSYSMKRNISLPNEFGQLTSSYKGNTAALSSQIAMPLQWNGYVFRPLAALDVNYVQQNGATESGYNAIRLHYHSSDWVQVLGRVGVQTEYTYQRWDLNSALSFSTLFAGGAAPTVRNRFVTDGPAFKIDGNDLGSHFVALGLGARRWLNEENTRMLFLQYNGEYSRKSNAQTAMIGCQFMF